MFGHGSCGDDFEGAIDDLAIWRRALSNEEIAILAAGQSFDILLGRAAGVSLEGDLTLGDADGDGTIGQGDLDRVFANWGEGEPPEVIIPEPASALGLGGMLLMCLRRGVR